VLVLLVLVLLLLLELTMWPQDVASPQWVLLLLLQAAHQVWVLLHSTWFSHLKIPFLLPHCGQLLLLLLWLLPMLLVLLAM
jgi:hypothetical protein